jgi:hypothetical protein
LVYATPDMTGPRLVDLSTGERRIVSLPAGSFGGVSLSNDGQMVAFGWQHDVYVAAVAAADWVSQGRVLIAPDGLPYDATNPVISADGRAVYLTVVQYEPTGGPNWNRLLEVPVDGGQPRVLFELRYRPGGGNVIYMWTSVCRDPDGEWLLAFGHGYVYRIEISTGAVIRLPFPEGQPYDAAW